MPYSLLTTLKKQNFIVGNFLIKFVSFKSYIRLLTRLMLSLI